MSGSDTDKMCEQIKNASIILFVETSLQMCSECGNSHDVVDPPPF